MSGGFIDPRPGGELIDLRKKFVLPGLSIATCTRHRSSTEDTGCVRSKIPIPRSLSMRLTTRQSRWPPVSLPCATSAPVIPKLFSHCGPPSPRERWRDRGFSASAPLSRPLAVMARSMIIATMFAFACNQPREFATASTNVTGRCAGTGGVLSNIKLDSTSNSPRTKSARSSKRPIAWAGASLPMRMALRALTRRSKRGCRRHRVGDGAG